jgi:outer membrane protein assembly factor BamB
MAALSKNLVLTGIKGHVIALDKTTGREMWRTKLKRADFVNLLTDGNLVFAATSGEVYCLDGTTGSILWNNPMRGLGLGLVSLLAGNGEGGNALVAEESRRAHARQQAAAGAG